MRYLVSGKEMKLLDQNTSAAFHIPELILMEQAAMTFVQRLFELDQNIKKVLVVCGSGNNGADGLAIARLLNDRMLNVDIWTAGERAGLKTSRSYEVQKKIIQAYQIPILECIDETKEYDLIIDALFGIGLSRKIEGELGKVIGQLNEMHGWKVAVDIASGVDPDNGSILGTAFCAQDTFTFSFGKIGQYLWPGCENTGTVHILPMGITERSWLEKKPRLAVLEEDALSALPVRWEHSNKGTYGKLLVIAGNHDMAGAACLAAKAAYRTGCGMVKVLTTENNRPVVQMTVPEALVCVYGQNPEESVIVENLKWADAIVLGPGIGTDRAAEKLVSLVLQNCAVPILVDADALNVISAHTELLMRPHTDMIVTPHLGEMARLTGDTVSYIQTCLVETAVSFAQTYDVICVLKDFHTITAVPYGLSYLNLTGNNGMATAGSGDVLSGITGSLLAQGMKPEQAAALGVYLHGRAGDAGGRKAGLRPLMASDIIDGLTDILC